jgi:hypothetical protein
MDQREDLYKAGLLGKPRRAVPSSKPHVYRAAGHRHWVCVYQGTVTLGASPIGAINQMLWRNGSKVGCPVTGAHLEVKAASKPADVGSFPTAPATFVDDATGTEVTEDWWPTTTPTRIEA